MTEYDRWFRAEDPYQVCTSPLCLLSVAGEPAARRGARPPRWAAGLRLSSPPPSLQVGWTKDYEPWYIIDRFLNPFYDRWVFYVRGEADAVE